VGNGNKEMKNYKTSLHEGPELIVAKRLQAV